MAEWKESKLIGRKAHILDENGICTGDWGTVIAYDGDYYHVQFANDKNNVLTFKRNEIYVPRKR